MQAVHDQAGHFGQNKTFEVLMERFYWPGYAFDVAGAWDGASLGSEALATCRGRRSLARSILKQISRTSTS